MSMAATSPARSGVSPSSSPRLPSPPPFTEVQLAPASPTVGDADSDFSLGDSTEVDEGAARRIRPGTKAADMASGPPLIPLHKLDSPFQLQEHLHALHCHLTKSPDDASRTIPVTKDTALLLSQPPKFEDTGEPVDKGLWLYELCRFLMKRTNALLVNFFSDNPPCSAETCPEMRASEWQYLCAVHDPPKSCAAIDYCCHTLDWAANILTSPKHFPSRLSLGGDGQTPQNSMRQLVNIFRRVYRILAHAWFQHREIFWHTEARDGLYIFFKTVCDMYQLIPDDNYTIPPEAEGMPEDVDEQKTETPIATQHPDFANMGDKFGKMSILRRDQDTSGTSTPPPSQIAQPDTTVSVGATTRRHKQTPSTGSAVTMIQEETEGDDYSVAQDSGAPGSDVSEAPQQAHPPPPMMSMSMPKFEMPGAPADPTPTAHDTPDPLAAAGEKMDEETTTSASAKPQQKEREVPDEALTVDTEATTLPANEPPSQQQQQHTSPVLDAILGHMDETVQQPQQTMEPTEEASENKTESSKGNEEDAEDIGEPIPLPAAAAAPTAVAAKVENKGKEEPAEQARSEHLEE